MKTPVDKLFSAMMYFILLLLQVIRVFGTLSAVNIPNSFDNEEDSEVCEVFGLPLPEPPKSAGSSKPNQVYSYFSSSVLTPKATRSQNTESLLSLMQSSKRELEKPEPVVVSPKNTITAEQLESLKEECVRTIKKGETFALLSIVRKLNTKQPHLNFSELLFDDEDGAYSLLHLAVKNDNYEAFNDLLELGVSSDLKDGFGRDIISYICERRNPEFLEIILSYEPFVKASHILGAIRFGYVELLEKFTSAGIDIYEVCGNKAMEMALKKGNTRLIQYLESIENV